MDERRFEELEAKKLKGGLTDDEANELGRLWAEKEGKPYGNADSRPHPEAVGAEREEGVPYTEEELDELRERSELNESGEEGLPKREPARAQVDDVPEVEEV